MDQALRAALKLEFQDVGLQPVHRVGILLLTDGAATDRSFEDAVSGSSAEIAGERNCALFPIVLGEERAIPQIFVQWKDPRSTVLCGETAEFSVRVFAEPRAGQNVEVRLLDAETETVLARTLCAFEGQTGFLDAELKWKPEEVKKYSLRLECSFAETDGEKTQSALKAGGTGTGGKAFLHTPLSISLNAAERIRRVLLVTAVPTWEFRALRNLLARETSVHLETWSPSGMPLAPDPKQDACQRTDFPTAEELRGLDVLILNSVSPEDLGEENLKALAAAWFDVSETSGRPKSGSGNALQKSEVPEAGVSRRAVSRGLILIAGRHFRPESWERAELGRNFLLSFSGMMQNAAENGGTGSEETEERKLLLTPEGFASELFRGIVSDDFAQPVFHFWNVPQTFSGAEILGKCDGFPILIRSRGQDVSTLFHASENLWRWRKNSEDVYRNYWIQAIHSLCRTNAETQTLQAKGPAGTETAPEEETLSTPLSAAVPPVLPLPSEIPGQPLEFRRSTPDPVGMQNLARYGNGTFFHVKPAEDGDAETIAREILLTLHSKKDAGQENAAIRTLRRPIWPFCVFPVILCLTYLWIRERKASG